MELSLSLIHISISRSAKPDAVEKEINKQLRMNGVVVNDTSVICGMEEHAQGIYIPVALKDGVPKSQESLLNADEMPVSYTHLDVYKRQPLYYFHR